MKSATPPAKRPNLQPLQAAELPNALLNLPTTAAITGLSVPTLYRLEQSGQLRMTRLGKRCTRVHSEDLRAFMASLK
jgi:excisionase family DNA binding protein